MERFSMCLGYMIINQALYIKVRLYWHRFTALVLLLNYYWSANYTRLPFTFHVMFSLVDDQLRLGSILNYINDAKMRQGGFKHIKRGGKNI